MQLSYLDNFAMARAGMLADMSPRSVMSRIGDGNIRQGCGVFRSPGIGAPSSTPPGNPGRVWQSPGVSIAADAAAIMAAGTAVPDAGLTVTSGFTGTIGAAEVFPPRQITVTLNNNAAWDADPVGLVITYINHLGVQVSETRAVPDAGNTVLTTTGYAARIVSLVFTALSSNAPAATFSAGYAAIDGTLNLSDFIGVAILDTATVESSPLSAAPTVDTAIYADGATVPVLDKGKIWVTTEDTCVERGAVYVRIAASGANTQIGAFRSDADGGNAVLVTNARWDRDSSAGGLNVLVLI